MIRSNHGTLNKVINKPSASSEDEEADFFFQRDFQQAVHCTSVMERDAGTHIYNFHDDL